MREACAAYRTPMDYGLFKFGLERVAALISAGFPTRISYVAYPNNAFDTHVAQADTHARILTYTSTTLRCSSRTWRGLVAATMWR